MAPLSPFVGPLLDGGKNDDVSRLSIYNIMKF